MILIIFIVNTSDFAYFFFKSGDSHEGRQRDCLCSSHRVAFALSSLSQTVVVSACRAITFMSALLHVSNSVMFVYTFNIFTPATICSRIP